MTNDLYQVEFEIEDIKQTAKEDWVRYSIRGRGNPKIYAGFSTGKNAVEGIENLKVGDYVTLQCRDVEKYHNIVKILDVAEGKVKETLTPGVQGTQKRATMPNEPIPGQEIGMWFKEVGENIRVGKLTWLFGEEKAKELVESYKKKMIEVLGI